jgi:hypothetical protein
MTTTRRIFLATAACLYLASTVQTFAVVGVGIQVQGTNLVLSWPSHGYETYLIQYRPTLDPSTLWTDLTNNYPANSTNRTTYIIPCCALAALGGGGDSFSVGGGSSASSAPLAISGLGESNSDDSTDLWAMPKDGSGDAVPLVLYPEGFDTSSLVLVEPPKPEAEAESTSLSSAAFDGPEANGPLGISNGGCDCPNMGFFRVFDVSPVAVPAFFGVGQDGSQNQLNIFRDDYDPNDDFFFLSNVVTPQHGTIVYSLDASTFQYTPTAGFYGIDSFNYSITNLHGGTAFATVTVFVNQSGNNPPSANDVTLTLQTNVYTAAFNAITNSSDPDGDTETLFAVTSPRYGSVSNDASGNITYTRNPAFFGSDTFTYVVTDGKGGYVVGNALVQQVDTSGAGMSDQWLLKYGMDFTADNSTGDPDGDGLPNLAEYLLGTNPKRSDNPLNLPTLANGISLNGYAQLPLVGISPMVPAPAITLFVDGNPAANVSLTQGPDGLWSIYWDTTHSANGSHFVQVGFQYNPDASTNLVYGIQKSIVVTNLMTFDQLTSRFTDFLLIGATLYTSNANYTVQLYDDYGDPLVSTSGSTTNGRIQLYWDLTDGNGHQISFGNVLAEFNLSTVGQGPQGLGNPIQEWLFKEPSGSSGSGFVVAWGWDFYLTYFNNYHNQMMGSGVIDILGNPSDPTSYTLAPPANQPFAGTSFRFNTATDKQTLLSAIQQNSYFFWLGHGSYNAIAGNTKVSNIAPSDVQKVLGNYSYQSSPKHPKQDQHPYKLAVLNGCETYTALWAGAFGVDFSSETSTNIVLEYQFTGRMPRAFVGWTQQNLVPNEADVSGLTHSQFGQALGALWSDWMSYYPLDVCVDDFSDTAIGYGFTGQDSWRISGCTDLHRGD